MAMTMTHVDKYIVIPGLKHLNTQMHSPAARAMLLAIGMQESRLKFRQQLRGSAKGLWQFEIIAVAELLRHPRTRLHTQAVLQRLDYPLSPDRVYHALDDNDILAAVLARLLLWTVPDPLPSQNNVWGAWAQYRKVWKPGKNYTALWTGFYTNAWNVVRHVPASGG